MGIVTSNYSVVSTRGNVLTERASIQIGFDVMSTCIEKQPIQFAPTAYRIGPFESLGKVRTLLKLGNGNPCP